MYWIAISPRLSRGRSTPEMRAIVSNLLSSHFTAHLGPSGCLRHSVDPRLAPRRAISPLTSGRPGASGTRSTLSSHYPCRCLWRGFLQMMRTTRSRRTILQCSHRTLTDGLTFISCPFELFHRSPQAALCLRHAVDLQLALHVEPFHRSSRRRPGAFGTRP